MNAAKQHKSVKQHDRYNFPFWCACDLVVHMSINVRRLEHLQATCQYEYSAGLLPHMYCTQAKTDNYWCI